MRNGNSILSVFGGIAVLQPLQRTIWQYLVRIENLHEWARSAFRYIPYVYMEKEMATHSSTLAWKIPWTEEPCRLQSMGSQRVGHGWAASLHFMYTKKLYYVYTRWYIQYNHCTIIDKSTQLGEKSAFVKEVMDKYTDIFIDRASLVAQR